MRRSTALAIAGALAAVVAGAARAQTIPEGQSCGGLLCDLGVFGHKSAPVPPPVAPAPAATTPAPKAVAVPAEAVEPRPHPSHHRRLAKAHVEKPRVAKAQAAPPPVSKTPVTKAALPASAAPAPPMAPAIAAPPLAAMQPPAPVRQRPLIFQSIDPMLQ